MDKTFLTAKGTHLPLLNLKGKDYLQVQHRVLWFREEHPDWSILTEFVSVTDDSALAKASIVNDTGVTVATSHKFEDKRGFGDYREKAETGAVGRALALCGYGTQFASELDEEDRIVDSPVARHTKPKASLPATAVPIHSASKTADPGDWVVNSGREHYGKKLKEIPDAELMRCIQLIKDYAFKNKQDVSGPSLQFIEKAEAYLGKKFDDEVKFPHP